MFVLAHAADGIFAAPVVVVVAWLAFQAIRDRRRERRERREGRGPGSEEKP